MSRRWTESEDMLVETMLQQGSSVVAVAQKTRRTYAGVRTRLVRNGSSIRKERARPASEVRNRGQVAALFGVCPMTAHRWITLGWLAARRNGAWSRRKAVRHDLHYLITDDALMEFIDRRETWVSWDAAKITDADWREYAMEIRASARGEWVLLKDFARSLGRPYTTVFGWWQRGLMDRLTMLRHGRQVYIWSADLKTFIPPRRPANANRP